MRHRLSMGTIVSDASLKVQYVSGKYIGNVEESFTSAWTWGDVSFCGMNSSSSASARWQPTFEKQAQRKRVHSLGWWTNPVVVTVIGIYPWAIVRLRLWPSWTRACHVTTVIGFTTRAIRYPDKTSCSSNNAVPKKAIIFSFIRLKAGFVHEGMAKYWLRIAWARSGRLRFPWRWTTTIRTVNRHGNFIEDLLQEHALFSPKICCLISSEAWIQLEMAKRKIPWSSRISEWSSGLPWPGIKVGIRQASSSCCLMWSPNTNQNLSIRQAYQEALDQQLRNEDFGWHWNASGHKMLNHSLSNHTFAFCFFR